MKLEFGLDDVKCHRKIDIVQDDSVWFYAYAVGGKWNADKTDVIGKPIGSPFNSELVTGVEGGESLTFRQRFVFEVPDDDSIEAVAVKYAIYDKDKGDLREALLKEHKVIETESMTASKLIENFSSAVGGLAKKDIMGIVAALADAVFEGVRGLRGDDLIGHDELPFDVSGDSLPVGRSSSERFVFKRRGDLGKRCHYVGKAVCKRIE